MPTYFISDLHLSPAVPRVTAGFYAFLDNQAKGADALYILGDFFDAWIGDDDDDSYIAEVKTRLLAYNQAGGTTFFIHGNRDFLIGEGFAEQTGVTLLPEATTIDLYGRNALIMHGDTLCTHDVEYMQFRAMVHNPGWQQQVLSLPLPHRRQMAADLRSKSQSMNAMKASDIMDVTPEEVVKAMEDAGVDLLIHGHTHRPKVHPLEVNGQSAQRIVLGDWHDSGWYLMATDDGKLDLTEFTLP